MTTSISAVRRGARTLAFAALVAGAAGLAASTQADAAGKRTPAIQSTLYFGLSTPNGKGVSEQQWATFLKEVVTPRFPDGLTVFGAYGQGGGGAPSTVTGETTKVLLIVHPDTKAAAARLEKINEEYRRRFGQAAFRTEQPVTIVE